MSIGGTTSTSSTVNPNYVIDNYKTDETESVVGSGLVDTSSLRQIKTDMGKDEFLQILIAQLANQDPMEPMKDTDFIAQMAQFSSLEQMQAMNATFQTGQAYNYVGKTVVATTNLPDENGNWVQTDLTGVVSGIEFKNNTPYLIVGEYLVPMESVSQVYQSSNLDSSILQGGALVGKYVTASKAAADGSMTEISGKVTKVLIKNGRVYAQIDGKEELPVANITAIDDDPIGPAESTGNPHYTGNPLDLYIDGKGSFITRDSDGVEGYTAVGNFKMDADGNLVTSKGDLVLGFPTKWSGGNLVKDWTDEMTIDDLTAIKVDTNLLVNFSIKENGEVVAKTRNSIPANQLYEGANPNSHILAGQEVTIGYVALAGKETSSFGSPSDEGYGSLLVGYRDIA